MTVWSHRFAGKTDDLLRRHGDSFSFDIRLLPEEVRASTAHANALGRAGVLTERETARITRSLAAMERDHLAGRLDITGDHEDVHSFVEADLGRRIGKLAGKLHTARSRNDQVATIYRLWIRDRIDGDLDALTKLAGALLAQAESYPDALLPAYTHLQRAQPVLLAHHLLAHVEALLRDRERFVEARRRVDLLPLGAGAGTGVGFRIDRRRVARELGFRGLCRNSLDAVSDRDFMLDYLSAGAVLGIHLSRLAEEVTLFTSSEFSFARLGDAASTGSSIMPQKRNPDGAELVRGKAGRVAGLLTGLLMTMKGLPLSYNKDLQEGGPAILDGAETVRAALELATVTVKALTFFPDRMAAALRGGFSEATELADWLAARGVPFREAHGVSARLVAAAEAAGVGSLCDLDPEVVAGAHPKLDPSVMGCLAPEAAVRAKDVVGGTAPRRIGAEIRRLRGRI